MLFLYGCRVFGREAIFVDLEADPKIDKDNHPDLAKYVPEARIDTQQAAEVTPKDAAATNAKPNLRVSGTREPAATGSKMQNNTDVMQKHQGLCDVALRADELLQLVGTNLLYCIFV
jgi:hypothetical protein